MFRGMLGILLFSLRIPSPDSLFAFILASYVSVPVFFFHFLEVQLSLLNKAVTEKVSNHHVFSVVFQNI